jgi:hypothetical protein
VPAVYLLMRRRQAHGKQGSPAGTDDCPGGMATEVNPATQR